MRKKLLVTAVIVVVALGAGVAGAQVQQRFNDVPTDHYAYEAANWAADAGITQGCGDGTNFCPERNLNRANMVTFLKRYHDWSHPEGEPSNAVRPTYKSYEAAVLAASEWYDKAVALIDSTATVSDWDQVTQSAAERAADWAGEAPRADGLAVDAFLRSRHGDTVDEVMGTLKAAQFYAATAGFGLAWAASATAQNAQSELEVAAAAAAWSAAGARLTNYIHSEHSEDSNNRFHCKGCEIGGFDRSLERLRQDYTPFACCEGLFQWDQSARNASADARRAYFQRTEPAN